MEKVKDVVIGVLITGIILVIVYLTIILTTSQVIKLLVTNMYNVEKTDELVVYPMERENAKGDKIRIPIINLDYENIRQINKDNFEKDVSDVCEQSYIYYVENNLLYVLIRTDYKYANERIDNRDGAMFNVYIIDTSNGELVVDNNTLLEQYYKVSLNKEKYLEVMKNKYYDKWQEKNLNSDINEFEQFINSMCIFISRGNGHVLVKNDVDSDKYDEMLEINIYDVINREEVK